MIHDTEGNPMFIAGQDPDVYVQIALERNRQDRKWGPQDHPDIDPGERGGLGFAHGGNELREDMARCASYWKHMNDARVKQHRIAWDGILLEEVYEALAEEDTAKLRGELVQSAAVIVAWIEAIDRRKHD